MMEGWEKTKTGWKTPNGRFIIRRLILSPEGYVAIEDTKHPAEARFASITTAKKWAWDRALRNPEDL